MLPTDRFMDTMVGTPVYACPKFMLAAVGRRQPVDLRKADAYSAGATLHEVLTGRLPTPLASDAGYADYEQYFDRRVSHCCSKSDTRIQCKCQHEYVGLPAGCLTLIAALYTQRSMSA